MEPVSKAIVVVVVGRPCAVGVVVEIAAADASVQKNV